MSTVMKIDIFMYSEFCINLVGGEICSGIVSHYTPNWFIQYLDYIFWQPAFTKPFFLCLVLWIKIKNVLWFFFFWELCDQIDIINVNKI